MCAEWPQNDHECYKAKGTPYTVYKILPVSPKFHSVLLYNHLFSR